jgi:hypothetical protein
VHVLSQSKSFKVLFDYFRSMTLDEGFFGGEEEGSVVDVE